MTTTPPAPTVTALGDANPCPRTIITITGMPADAATATVWRYADGTRSIVRGASNTPVAGDTAIIDYWTPLGVDVTYTVQTADTAGTPSQTSPTSTPVNVDSLYAWLSDPLDPRSSMPVALTSNSGLTAEARFASFRTATYSLAGDTVTPVFGSPYPVGSADLRQAAAGVPIEIRTYDLATFAQLRDLLAQAYPLCVRAGVTVPLIPGVAYLRVPSVTPTFDPDNTTCVWSMTGDSVAPPGASVVIPARTLDDLGDEASSLDGLSGLYSSLVAAQIGA